MSSTRNLQQDETIIFHETALGNVNTEQYVDVMKSRVGRLLISSGFGPCQAVIAILANGEFGVYHAYSGFKTDAMMEFVDSIKDLASHIYVFQKSMPENNMLKAPYLAIELARELNCKVTRIHADNYTGIYVNADTMQIILFNKSAFAINNDMTELSFSGKPELLTHSKQISLKDSVHELFKKHQSDYKVDQHGLIINTVVIPEKLIPSDIFSSIHCKSILNDTKYSSKKTAKITKCQLM